MMIEYPTDIEVQQAIINICDKAIKKPAKITTFLRDMIHNLGIRYIFYGSYDALAVSLCIFMFTGFWLGHKALNNPAGEILIFAIVFSLAPMMFMLLSILSFWKEREEKLYSLKMACKYTVKHLLAFRMFSASILGLVSTTGYVLVLCRLMNIEIIHVLSVAYASLFLFSIVMVQIVLTRESFLSVVLFGAIWLLLNAICFAVANNVYSLLLRAVPSALWISIDTILVVVLIRKYRMFVRRVCNACG